MKNKISAFFMRASVKITAVFTTAVLAIIVISIVVHGLPSLKPSLFAWQYNSVNVSLTPALLNTLFMTVLSLIFAVPLGIASAVYLVEYARRGSTFVSLVRLTAETLAGIPSIIYGLFGLLFFVTRCHMGISLISGALTLAIMILPLIMRTAEEALLAVPDSYREGSFGLGAGRLRTTTCIILPAAMPGILSGIILAVGRIAGETAALIYTAGTVAKVAFSPASSARTLAVHMYVLSCEGLYMDQSYGTALILLAVTACMNWLSGLLSRRLAGNVKV
ncbi:MAG: phosphate ABC transporter permease PstA [Pyramidobacter sp.]